MIPSRPLALGLVACATFAWSLPSQALPNPALDRAHHVLRRITFGPTPDLVTRLAQPPVGTTPLQAAQAYITEQLNPAPGPTYPNWPYGSPVVQTLAAPGGTLGVPAAPTPGVPFGKLINDGTQLVYGLASPWQLREVMAQFWDRHFNTHLYGAQFYFNPYLSGTQTLEDYSTYFEWEANNYYRDNGLGTFHDLLDFTSKHVTMVVYLHLYRNIVAAPGQEPNEDYARELVELFTMGSRRTLPSGAVVPNYDQNDIETIAAILSGWSVDPNNAFQFVFNAANHAGGPKPAMFTVSGTPYSLPLGTAGLAEGDQLLLHLAGRDATQDFICRKLIDYFLGDGATSQQPALLAAMKAAWGPLGDIKAVLNQLFTFNGIFLDPTSQYVLDRARLPLEAVLAPPRAFDAKLAIVSGTPSYISLFTTGANMELMGQSLVNYPAPIGFPQSSLAQQSPSSALRRIALGAQSLFPAVPGVSLDYDIPTFLGGLANPLDPFQIEKLLLETLYGTNYSLADESAMLQTLVNATLWLGANPAAPTAAEYKTIVDAATVTAMGMVQGGAR